MPRINYPRAVILWLFIVVCFSYGELSLGSIVNFTIPKNYDPTATLSLSQYKEGELLVRFAPKDEGAQTTTEEKNVILTDLGGGEIKRTYKLVPGLNLVKLPEGVKVEEVLGNFNKAAGILYAQPNYILRAASTFPNDPQGPIPYGGEQWGLHNTGQNGGALDADIDAPEAWDIATDSNIIVAVIDSGIDYIHPDLTANMWRNTREVPDNGEDDDGHGYIDDIL
jgi:subtilisin family serine protease